eukprot:COSAG01_NODE_1392_length_10483_cov_26.368163_13_plen_471_part_00
METPGHRQQKRLHSWALAAHQEVLLLRSVMVEGHPNCMANGAYHPTPASLVTARAAVASAPMCSFCGANPRNCGHPYCGRACAQQAMAAGWEDGHPPMMPKRRGFGGGQDSRAPTSGSELRLEPEPEPGMKQEPEPEPELVPEPEPESSQQELDDQPDVDTDRVKRVLLAFYADKFPEFATLSKVNNIITSFKNRAPEGRVWIELLRQAYRREGYELDVDARTRPNAEIELCFEDEGALGILFGAADESSPTVVRRIKAGSQAEVHVPAGLRQGLILSRVNGDDVTSLCFDEILRLVDTPTRPLRLTFHAQAGSNPRPGAQSKLIFPQLENAAGFQLQYALRDHDMIPGRWVIQMPLGEFGGVYALHRADTAKLPLGPSEWQCWTAGQGDAMMARGHLTLSPIWTSAGLEKEVDTTRQLLEIDEAKDRRQDARELQRIKDGMRRLHEQQQRITDAALARKQAQEQAVAGA